MNISSPVFVEGESIPTNYTCEGANLNPPLNISDVPSDATSLVLLVEDWDSPAQPYSHWVVFNIPPQATEISEESLPEGAIQGITSGKVNGYEGPCPPQGKHAYQFKLYALDKILDLPATSDRSAVFAAMYGHILAEASLTGYYEKGKVPEPQS
jgi:Raf kinase inhibitor-like YbhB/YbcL family protein